MNQEKLQNVWIFLLGELATVSQRRAKVRRHAQLRKMSGFLPTLKSVINVNFFVGTILPTSNVGIFPSWLFGFEVKLPPWTNPLFSPLFCKLLPLVYYFFYESLMRLGFEPRHSLSALANLAKRVFVQESS